MKFYPKKDFTMKVSVIIITDIETNSWMADGKPLQSSQSQTYKDENGTTYFWNEVKKLWVTGKFFGSTVLVEKNTDQIALIYTTSVRLTMI